MEQILPPITQHGAGFESTRVRQFTVFLDNRVGRLQALITQLEADSKILALDIQESADTALVRIICSNPDLGREQLLKGQFPFAESDVLAVELPKGSKHPLVAICAALLSAEINIHYAYPLLFCPHGPTLVLYLDEATLAAEIMIRKGFRIIGESDLRS